jgi:hypothetical protein
MKATTKPRMKAIKVMFNDDVAIIDFLADLVDEEPIRGLQRFVNYSNQQPVCLLFNCPFDDLFLVLLYKAPMGFNERDNKLVLFAYDNLLGLYNYFERWLKQTSETDGNVYGTLSDVLGAIAYELNKIHEKNIQADWLG